MRKKQLIIYDLDETYAENLMEYLSKIPEFPYAISAVSEREVLLARTESIDLLLVSESAYEAIREEVRAEHTVLLNESGEITWKDLQNIRKYQSAEGIVRELLVCYAQTEDPSIERLRLGQETRIIGFFSPVRRCSQTTMGLTLGQVLAEKGPTLYLNFESLSGFPGLLGYEEGRTLTDLLYYLETMPDRFGAQFRACVRKLDHLDYVLPMDTMHGLLLVAAEKWRQLLGAILQEEEYAYMILDLSEGMQGLFEILRLCDQVYTLTREDLYAQAKIRQYEQLLQWSDCEDILQKTIKTKVPYMREIPDGLSYRPGGEMTRFVKKLLQEDGLCG